MQSKIEELRVVLENTFTDIISFIQVVRLIIRNMDLQDKNFYSGKCNVKEAIGLCNI